MSGTTQPSVVRFAQALALLLATAATLRLLDWLPRSVTRAARIRDLPSIEAVERATGRRLALPAWFPRSLPWPPSRVRVLGGGPDAVAIELGAKDAGSPMLILAESVREPMPLPESFFPPAILLETRHIPWGTDEARLSRFRGEDGATWMELAWEQGGQTFAFRSRGSLEQLLDLAQSVHREGP
jgi:hypothetical protein